MNGWSVAGLVLLLLFLLGQIRVGVRARYSADGLLAWLRLGGLRLRVFPLKPKKKKRIPKAEQPKKAPDGARTPEKTGGALTLLRELLPVILDGAGWCGRKLRMDTLYLEVTVGAADPADAAMAYGRANALLGALWGPITHAFHVKDGRAATKIDFDRDTLTVYGTAAISLKLWQGAWLGIYFGIRALSGVLRVRSAQKAQAKQQQQQQRKAA